MEAVSEYDEQFFIDEARVAAESAAVVVPWVTDQLAGQSYIDVGGGTGEWVKAFLDWNGGVGLCVDLHAPSPGDIIEYPRLYADISNGVDCTGWDLAICLEVAEHLEPESAEPLVAGLAKANTVLWSAATPGQPGVSHINCQPPEYWEGLFNADGMTGEYIGHNFTDPVADFYVRNLWLFRKAS